MSPSNYKIRLDLDFDRFEYIGHESITVTVRRSAGVIALNAKDIDIIEASVDYGKSRLEAALRIIPESERIELRLKRAIAGSAVVNIKFKGRNNDRMYGFYRSSYKAAGKTCHMLTTQFEAADARAAFPCFDEPAFKATFDLSLVMDKDLEALSNTEIKSQKVVGNRKEIAFETTPRMSDYLLYIGVGRFEYTEGSLGGLKIRVISTPGKKAMCALPLEFAKKFVSFYQQYFGVAYPLKKLDLIAVPDFAVGAMENWGAITFREIALLADESTSVANKQRIAEVIAHELAHQWFGDLVTMKWWNDLWLNESFATFMSYKAIEATFPEWDMGTQYFLDVIGTAFNADALESTHPISVDVKNPKEIDSIFDEISYEKGGSVLHMIEDYSGKETFRSGLSSYIKAHAYSNATKQDLWKAIDRAAAKSGRDKKVGNVAGYWVTKPGYPIIKCKVKGTTVSVSQERFTMLGRERKGTWPIPLHIMDDRGTQKMLLMQGRSIKFKTAVNGWVKLNYGQSGLYRVSYDAATLPKLGAAISSGKLKGKDAWGIENDLFTMARCGKIQLNDYTDFLRRYCMGDPDSYPINFSVSGHLAWLQFMLYGTRLQGKIDELILYYNDKAINEIGWTKKQGEANTTTMLRAMAVSSLGITGHRKTIEKANELFSSYISTGKQIDPNIRGAVYKIAAWNGNAGLHKKLQELYKKTTNPEEQRRIIIALGMFRDESLLQETLDFSFSSNVKLQDAYIPAAIIADNPFGKMLIWDWSKRNWPMMLTKFMSGTHILRKYVENMDGMADKKSLTEFNKFFGDKKNIREDIDRSVSKTAERIEANINFINANIKN